MSTAGAEPVEREVCAQCGGPVLPVLYGFPSKEGFDAADRGEVMLGGCVIGLDDVTASWECGATMWRASDE